VLEVGGSSHGRVKSLYTFFILMRNDRTNHREHMMAAMETQINLLSEQEPGCEAKNNV
jgi:uncharacterized membrane protein